MPLLERISDLGRYLRSSRRDAATWGGGSDEWGDDWTDDSNDPDDRPQDPDALAQTIATLDVIHSSLLDLCERCAQLTHLIQAHPTLPDPEPDLGEGPFEPF